MPPSTSQSRCHLALPPPGRQPPPPTCVHSTPLGVATCLARRPATSPGGEIWARPAAPPLAEIGQRDRASLAADWSGDHVTASDWPGVTSGELHQILLDCCWPLTCSAVAATTQHLAILPTNLSHFVIIIYSSAILGPKVSSILLHCDGSDSCIRRNYGVCGFYWLASHRTARPVFWPLKPAVSSDQSIPAWQSHKM